MAYNNNHSNKTISRVKTVSTYPVFTDKNYIEISPSVSANQLSSLWNTTRGEIAFGLCKKIKKIDI